MANEKSRQAARPSHAAPRMRGRCRAQPGAGVGEDEGISTIRSGQGARVTTRKNAAEVADKARKNAEKRYFERHPEAKAPATGPERSGKNVVLRVVAALLVLAIVFVIGSCVTGLVSGFGREDTERPTQTLQLTEQEQQLQEQQMANDAGKEQVEVGGSLSFGGDSFALTQQEDGAWALVRTSSTGTSTTLFLLEGAPVALARISDTILIPENRNGGWDVVCYVIDGHSSASYVSSPDGTVVGGEGDAVSAELGDTAIVVTDSSGAAHEVSLV